VNVFFGMATLRRLSPFGRQRRPLGSSAVAAGSICQSMWTCGRNFVLSFLPFFLLEPFPLFRRVLAVRRQPPRCTS
jgi:hypothetical protein